VNRSEILRRSQLSLDDEGSSLSDPYSCNHCNPKFVIPLGNVLFPDRSSACTRVSRSETVIHTLALFLFRIARSKVQILAIKRRGSRLDRTAVALVVKFLRRKSATEISSRQKVSPQDSLSSYSSSRAWTCRFRSALPVTSRFGGGPVVVAGE
jgi:hypothetical protein